MDATPEPTKNKEKFIYFLRKFLRRKNREINVYLREKIHEIKKYFFLSCVFYELYYLNTEQIFLLFLPEKRKKQFKGIIFCPLKSNRITVPRWEGTWPKPG